MPSHPVVSPAEWLAARRKLLAQEKDFTRRRDELSALRRALPWTRVEKPYSFQGSAGPRTLPELFDGCSQLLVYHFMFDPAWSEGCKSCSLLADHYAPAVVHLRQRDVALVTVSRAPLAQLRSFQERMGWTFEWVSSSESDFNHDFGVTFTPEELAAGSASYNYGAQAFPVAEAPGLSVFAKDEAGDVYHTYSTYARGLDMFITAYHLLDVVPKGRDETALKYGMEWVRHHDRYGDPSFRDPYVQLFPERPAKP